MNDKIDLSRFPALRTSGGFAEPAVNRFARYVETAPEESLFRMSPLRAAPQLGISERESVDLFLHAAHVGILDFSWGVLCPMCASFLSTAGGLRSLREAKHCNFCQIDVNCDLDENIEVAFTVAPSVRHIRFHDTGALDISRDGFRLFFSPSLPLDGMFHKTLHQALIRSGRLNPNQVQEVRVDMPPGRYLFMAPESHSVAHFNAIAGLPPKPVEIDLLDGCWIPGEFQIPSGAVQFRLGNKTKRPQGYLLLPDPVLPPEMRPPDMAKPELKLQPFLSGKNLICTQAFRDLFHAQSIPSEGGLELKNLTVLFTDLKGSTELYERIGDLNAYDLVRQHFTTLYQISARQGGSVVKTIGDAIMATFPEPEAGLLSALDMNREIARVGGADLQLKIGLHCGSCIAVELNERLDYFGRTVNIASRVQNLAGAREILCTEPVYNASRSASIIQKAGLEAQPDQVVLKGIANTTRVYRIR